MGHGEAGAAQAEGRPQRYRISGEAGDEGEAWIAGEGDGDGDARGAGEQRRAGITERDVDGEGRLGSGFVEAVPEFGLAGAYWTDK